MLSTFPVTNTSNVSRLGFHERIFIAEVIIYKRPEDGCMQPKYVASVPRWQQLYVVLDQGSSTFQIVRATLTISMMPAGH
jgi:hypothetical protein